MNNEAHLNQSSIKQEIKQERKFNETIQNGIEERQTSEQVLIKNQQLLIEIMMESRTRKNKNIVSPKMAVLVNKLERNLIKICRNLQPKDLGEAEHIRIERDRFYQFYQKRNGFMKKMNKVKKDSDEKPAE